MFVSKEIYYVIRGLVYLSKKRSPVPIKEISKKEKIPYFFLEKIFQRLKKNGLINSQKGSGGGYFLLLSPKKITLKKIFTALKEKELLSPCSKICLKKEGCELKESFNKFYYQLNFLLNQITLDKFLKNNHLNKNA